MACAASSEICASAERLRSFCWSSALNAAASRAASPSFSPIFSAASPSETAPAADERKREAKFSSPEPASLTQILQIIENLRAVPSIGADRKPDLISQRDHTPAVSPLAILNLKVAELDYSSSVIVHFISALAIIRGRTLPDLISGAAMVTVPAVDF